MNRPRALVVGCLSVLTAGCQPALDDRPWLVTRPQIVGLTATPPETRPGTDVTFQVVVLDPTNTADPTTTAWSLCATPKPPADPNVVAPDCLSAPPDATGDPTTLTIPANACELFGPDVAQPAPGTPSSRPVDPDATGGYYQPIAIALAGSLAVGLERVTCDLPQASLDVARAFQASYHPNQNPAIGDLALTVNGDSVAVTVSWPAGSAETFARYDAASASVVQDQETLTVSWFVTGGTLDRAAVQTTDPSVLSATATWTAPTTPGTWPLAVTLRDSRGGMDARTTSLAVTSGTPPFDSR